MRSPCANSGRPRLSVAGSSLKVSQWTMVAARFAPFIGQALKLTSRGRNAAEGSAGADRDRRIGICADLFSDVDGSAPADSAVDAIFGQRDRAFNDGDVTAALGGDGVLQRFLGCLPRRDHDEFVVVPREKVEHDISKAGVTGAQ